MVYRPEPAHVHGRRSRVAVVLCNLGTPEAPRPAEVRRTEDHLRRHFGTDVDIRLKGQQKGEIRIAFYSPEDFDRLLELIGTRPA